MKTIGNCPAFLGAALPAVAIEPGRLLVSDWEGRNDRSKRTSPCRKDELCFLIARFLCMRAVAEKMPDKTCKQTARRIADDYERLAAHAEKRARPNVEAMERG